MKNTRKRVRLKDIAEAADVSVMSVSHVLNGTGMGRVSVGDERARHIIETAKKLSYVPSYAARALRGSSIRVIGAISYGVMNPVRVRALACLQWEAAQYDYHVMATSIEDKSMSWDVSVMAMLSHGVSALVAICDSLREIKQAEDLGKREGVMVIPLRLDGGRLEPETGGVQIDTLAGIELALESLRAAGSKRIKVYYTEEDRVWADCAVAYAAGYGGKGLEVQRVEIGADNKTEGVVGKVESGDGVLCSNDFLAALVIRGTSDLIAGADYSIIGWGNAAACEYMSPRLSSIGLDLPAVMGFAMNSILEDEKTEIMWVRPILLSRETSKLTNKK